jgi:hypothetical protein
LIDSWLSLLQRKNGVRRVEGSGQKPTQQKKTAGAGQQMIRILKRRGFRRLADLLVDSTFPVV